MKNALSQIASGFVAFAGSEENATALAGSLREGTPAELRHRERADLPETSAVFVPPTGPMEWNDVRLAIMLARDTLVMMGIARPRGDQICAAFLGGEVVSPRGRVVVLKGVLRMRSEGHHWGRIASERYNRPAIVRAE